MRERQYKRTASKDQLTGLDREETLGCQESLGHKNLIKFYNFLYVFFHNNTYNAGSRKSGFFLSSKVLQ